MHVTFTPTIEVHIEDLIRPNETKLIWIETPSNPTLGLVDIRAVVDIAHRHGILVVVDNTFMSPYVQNPLDHGADIVVHSVTKYINGHSDVCMGAAAFNSDAIKERLSFLQNAIGAIPSPFDCWLLLRGIRSLPWRMRGHCANAEAVARYLSTHPAIEAVHFPGLATHPGHDIAARQMSDFGGMLSIQLRDGESAAIALTNRLTLFTRATSLGGPESLIEHRASVEGPTTISPRNLLRVSVGLENAEDLIEDLERALG